MKRLTTSLALVFALVFVFGAVNASEEGAWFDMENCEMCAPMMAVDGLMQNMVWESHNISNGMMSIASTPAEFKEVFDAACLRMDELGAKMASGEKTDMKLCGHCKSYTSLMGMGAKVEKIDTKTGHVTLMTSSDEKVVGKIHAHVERTNAESAKMAEMMKANMKDAGHEGHDHD